MAKVQACNDSNNANIYMFPAQGIGIGEGFETAEEESRICLEAFIQAYKPLIHWSIRLTKTQHSGLLIKFTQH
jgi:hypothetical protein